MIETDDGEDNKICPVSQSSPVRAEDPPCSPCPSSALPSQDTAPWNMLDAPPGYTGHVRCNDMVLDVEGSFYD